MAKKKTNPKILSKKVAKPKKATTKKTSTSAKGAQKPSNKSLGTKRGNFARKKDYGKYLRELGHVVKPERVRKSYYKRGDEKTDKAIGAIPDKERTLRVPSAAYAPKWLSEPLRRALLAVVRSNKDVLFGRGGLLEEAITNTNGKAKSLGDGLIYVNMNKNAGMRDALKDGKMQGLRLGDEALDAFMHAFPGKKPTFTDANGRKIAIPRKEGDIKAALTKLLYLIPFGPDGKTF